MELFVVSMSVSYKDEVYLWSLEDQKYVKCFLNIKAPIEHIDWIDDSVYAIIVHGRLYKGKFNKDNIILSDSNLETSDGFIEQSRNKRTDLNPLLRLGIQLRRLPKIDRLRAFSVDESNESFVALQGNSMNDIDKPQLADEIVGLKDLLNEASEADTLHDIVFHVSLHLLLLFP